MRVLVTTAVLPGHFFPMVPLAWALRSAGHDVLVATPDNFVPTVLRSGLPAASCAPAIEFSRFMLFDRAGNRVAPPANPLARRESSGRAWGRLAAHSLPGTEDLIQRWRPDLVISERAEYAGPLVAAAQGVPWVQFHWGVARLAEYRPAAATELAPELARLGLGEVPAPELILDPCPPSMRFPESATHHSIRCVPYNGDAVVPRWVREPHPRPRVCLTFGTMLPRHGVRDVRAMLVGLMDGLGELDAELVVAVDDDIADSWKPLPPVVRYAGRLPLAQTLPGCDLLVHHGGQGSTFTALSVGVPQLALPQTADQFENAERLAAVGAGLQLLPEQADVPAVVKGCLELLSQDRYAQQARLVAKEIAAQPAPAAVVALLERHAKSETVTR